MLTTIKISAFKSLVDFELSLSKFNCIIGLNGAGKSTLLQLISYLSSLFRGDVNRWLEEHNWQANEVVSHYFPKRETIEIELELEDSGKRYRWQGTYNWKKGFCTKESFADLTDESKPLFRVYQNRYTDANGIESTINFQYAGSIVSSLLEGSMKWEAQQLKKYLSQIESHELLSPKVMRTGKFSNSGRVGASGESLISYIHNLDDADKGLVRERLAEYFPQVIKLDTKTQLNGTLALFVTERYYKETGEHIDIVTDARHINDGMLRILNLLANQRSVSKFQLFDEIENGINPEITEKLMDTFTRAPQQTLISTHSPMVLNYLDDETAKQSVILLYKKKNGQTAAIHLFSLPSALKKLECLAPGEAMVDLYLSDVAAEAEVMHSEKQVEA